LISFTLREIADATSARLIGGAPDAHIARVSTDSRSLQPGDLFFALAGDRFDAHDFVPQALAAGASGVVVHRPVECKGPAAVLLVRDTLTALADLARACRNAMSADFVAVTGSCGKTTVKAMIAAVLKPSLKIHVARKSFNNAVGVPLTVLDAPDDCRIVVLEMGTSAPGEIRRLAAIAPPDVGVITNVGPSHLEGLKSKSGVAAAKAELLDGLAPDALAILNWDDRWIRKMATWGEYNMVTFGRSRDADLIASNLRPTPEGIAFTFGRTDVSLPVGGKHNVYNALAAVAVGLRFRIPPDEIALRLASFQPPPLRMEKRTVAGVELLADCYNANPLSVRAALDEFCSLPASGRNVFVFAGMAELGDLSESLHQRVGRLVAKRPIRHFVAIGPDARVAADAAREAGTPSDAVHLPETRDQASSLLRNLLRPGDRVLFKASRVERLDDLFNDVSSKLIPSEV